MKTNSNFSKLEWAAEHGDSKETRRLLDEGKERPTHALTSLVAAYNHLDVMKVFIEKGIIPTTENLWYAARKGHHEMSALLKSHGVKSSSEIENLLNG